MATAALQPTRQITAGYFKVPNSFAENQTALIPAERALALIILRRAGDLNGEATISDRVWESWTGLAPRQKEYAIKGLREKGLMVTGRGDTAKFSWDWTRWNEALRNRETIVSPNADPKRKERTAKVGAKVHEECHDQGCAMLRAGQCPGDAAQSTAQATVQSKDGSKQASGLFLTKVAQSTAQSVERATEQAWAASMAALQSFFPILKIVFLMRLLQIVRGYFPTITDQELSEAIHAAFVPQQFSPMLFLKSVPNTIARLRREKKAALEKASPPGQLPHILPGMEKSQQCFDDVVRILKATKKTRGPDDDLN